MGSVGGPLECTATQVEPKSGLVEDWPGLTSLDLLSRRWLVGERQTSAPQSSACVGFVDNAWGLQEESQLEDSKEVCRQPTTVLELHD